MSDSPTMALLKKGANAGAAESPQAAVEAEAPEFTPPPMEVAVEVPESEEGDEEGPEVMTLASLLEMPDGAVSQFKVAEINDMAALLPELEGYSSTLKKAEKVALIEEALAHLRLVAIQNAKPSLTIETKTIDHLAVQVSDPITSAIAEIESVTNAEDAKAAVENLLATEGLNDFKLGGYLSHIQDNGWFMGHDTFQAFIEAELPVKYRKAMYLINIYNGLSVLGIPWEKVSSLGWTIIIELLPVLSAENVDQWLDAVKGLNRETVHEMVKKALAVGNDESEPEADPTMVKTLTFKAHADQEETIETALDLAMSKTGTTVRTVALEYICLQYNGAGGESVTFPTAKQYIAQLKQKNGGDDTATLLALLGDGVFEEFFPSLTMKVEEK